MGGGGFPEARRGSVLLMALRRLSRGRANSSGGLASSWKGRGRRGGEGAAAREDATSLVRKNYKMDFLF